MREYALELEDKVNEEENKENCTLLLNYLHVNKRNHREQKFEASIIKQRKKCNYIVREYEVIVEDYDKLHD